MIIDFLKKYQEELISEKIELKEDIDLLLSKINEDKKFLDLLENNNDKFSNIFTPRNLNEKDKSKASEIKNSLNSLEKSLSEKQEIMKSYDSRLSEINSLISEALNNNRVITQNNEDNSVSIDSEFLTHSLENIQSFLFLDPQRASIEIDNLKKSLK